jgi:hypothetical protein
MRRTFRRTTHFSKNEHPSSTSLSGLMGFSPGGPGECRASWRFTRFGSPKFAGGVGVLLRLRARTGFPLTLHSNRFRPDRMNGSGTPRFGAPSITESDFCNRREARAHPRATRLPARRRVQRRRLAIEGRGRQSTGYPAGSRAPALPIASTRPSFGTRRERPARIEADTLVGQRNGRKTRRGSGSLRAPRPAFDLPRER